MVAPAPTRFYKLEQSQQLRVMEAYQELSEAFGACGDVWRANIYDTAAEHWQTIATETMT